MSKWFASKSQSSQEAALFTGSGAGEAEARYLNNY